MLLVPFLWAYVGCCLGDFLISWYTKDKIEIDWIWNIPIAMITVFVLYLFGWYS